jgi:hypothetical protein
MILPHKGKERIDTLQDDFSMVLFAKKCIDFYSIIFSVCDCAAHNVWMERCPARGCARVPLASMAALQETSAATKGHQGIKHKRQVYRRIKNSGQKRITYKSIDRYEKGYWISSLFCYIRIMTSRQSTKKIIVEIIFWWVVLAIFVFLNDFRHPKNMQSSLTERLYISVQSISHVIAALIVTIISLLLQKILNRIK